MAVLPRSFIPDEAGAYITCCRVHRTFIEGVLLTPCPPRSRSWPDLSQSVVELFDAETETSETPDMVREPEEQPDPEVHDFDDEKGLHPGHDLWTGVNNLMICNLPARCTRTELSSFLTSLVAEPMNLSVPLSASGRNRGYAFVRAPERTIDRLVRALWQRSVPTRKSTRPLKLQPANMNRLQVSHKHRN
ncbi:unnamed protein product [Symbiodinium natans]|uniref:RRM domain-containing protein n=1 Tax=Symbiodinium natans TaxID=878477 RepID=A0A812HYN5_9DINO|nr:unnamed protein product [Symbiodinium natans]